MKRAAQRAKPKRTRPAPAKRRKSTPQRRQKGRKTMTTKPHDKDEDANREAQRQTREGPAQGPAPSTLIHDRQEDATRARSPMTAPATGAQRTAAEVKIAEKVHKVHDEFTAALPPAVAASGGYSVQDGDYWSTRELEMPDGRYRVSGGDWIYAFAGGKLKEASRALPPNYGGEGVTIV
jgi:hypothetical protein